VEEKERWRKAGLWREISRREEEAGRQQQEPAEDRDRRETKRRREKENTYAEDRRNEIKEHCTRGEGGGSIMWDSLLKKSFRASKW
jgi:hypothetical protein